MLHGRKKPNEFGTTQYVCVKYPFIFKVSSLFFFLRFVIFVNKFPVLCAFSFIGHCCCGVLHLSYARIWLKFWYPEQERMKPAEQFSLLFSWGYFDFFLWRRGPCVPWGWCVRSAGLWLRMRARCRPIKAGPNQSDAWQPAASPSPPRQLPVWEHSSAFPASFFLLFVLFHMSNLKLILLTYLLVMSWRVQQKKKKFILSIRQISLPLNLFKDLCKANLQLKCQTCSQNSKDPEDKAFSLAEDQMPVYAAFMTCLSLSVSEILGLIELVDVVCF